MKKIAAILCLCSIIQSPMVYSGGGAGNATEATQILNNIELAAQTLNMIERLENMILNTEYEIERALETYGVDEIISKYEDIREIIQRGEALAYTIENIDERFEERFRGYVAYTTRSEYETFHEEWTEGTFDTLKNTLAATGAQMEKFESEAERMGMIRDVAGTAAGRNALISAGNQITAMMMEQLHDLKQLTALQIQQQNAFMAAEEARAATEIRERRSYEGAEPIEIPAMEKGNVGLF